MGCHLSLQENMSLAASRRSKAIDKKIQAECKGLLLQPKLLLLGTGESGKSTIMKQIKIIHGSGFTADECLQHRPVVLSNALQSLQTIVRAMDQLGIGFANPESLGDARRLFSLAGLASDSLQLPTELASAMRRLLLDSGVLLCLDRRCDYQLNDSAEYFLAELDRICSPDYAPTEADVLRARVRTCGIAETRFQLGELQYHLLDVGGLGIGERKKWIHCFEGVAAVLFVVALSEFAYSGQRHAFEESFSLFDSVCSCRWFTSSQIVLLLNKTDLFRARLTRVPLAACFPEYTGPNEFGPAAGYIRLQFERRHSRSRDKEIYTHFLCSVDAENSRRVLQSVASSIAKHHVDSCELV